MLRILITFILAAFAFAAQAAVDVNKASQAELETVKGIGPGLSVKILAARKSGEFKDWTDLVDRVGGVGPGNAAKFSQAGLTVAGNGYTGGDTPAPKRQKGDKTENTAKTDKGNKADKPARAKKAAEGQG